MPANINRTQILRGPCQIQYGATPVIFYSKDDVVVSLNMKTINVTSSALGMVDYRDDDLDATITFTPDGQVTTALLAALFPFLQAGIYPGAPVFGATDQALVIWTRDGYKHTFFNAAVTKQPQFIASAAKTAFGQVTFTALRAMGSDWSDANSLAQITEGTYPGDSTFNLSNILTAKFSGRWFTGTVPTGTATASEASPAVFSDATDGLAVGDTVINTGYANPALNGKFTVATTPTSGTYTLYQFGTTTAVNNTVGADSGTFNRGNWYDAFETESGFMIDTNVTLDSTSGKSDSYGLLDMTIQMMEVTMKAIAIGPFPAQLISAYGIQGSGAGRGTSRASKGRDLYINGTGIYAKMTEASITAMDPIRSGMAVKRIGSVTWKSTMSLDDGVPQSPLQLSTSSIS